MTVYHYPESSPIQSIAFSKSANGNQLAYLQAGRGMPAEKLHDYATAMRAKGYFCTPYGLNETPMLEVRGAQKPAPLLDILQKSGAVTGKPTIHEEAENLSLIEKVKKRSLQGSGFFQMLGDANFFVYGMKEASKGDMIAGVLYALGTGELVAYGRNDQFNHQVKEFSEELMGHLRAHHVHVPDSCALSNIARDHQKGLFKSASDVLARYPSEIYNVFTGMAGLAVAHAAYNNKFKHAAHITDAVKASKMRQSGMLDIGLGLTTFAATAFGLLVNEKKRDPDEPPAENMIQRAWQWAQESPLKVTGMGLMVSTLCHAFSIAIDYNEAWRTGDKKALASVPWRAGFVGMNMIAEILIMISSKGHGEGVVADDQVKQGVYAAAAEMIHSQPSNMKKVAFDQTLNFLSQPTVFADSNAEVTGHLHRALAALQKNPWACVPDSRAEVVYSRQTASGNWQTKMMTQHTNALTGMSV